jgi:hypothetical protein
MENLDDIKSWITDIKSKIANFEQDMTDENAFEFALNVFIDMFNHNAFSDVTTLLSNKKEINNDFEILEMKSS